jgi:hypothetical protein
MGASGPLTDRVGNVRHDSIGVTDGLADLPALWP